MKNYGTVRPGTLLQFPFDTFAGSTGAPITMTNFAVGDIKIYKDGSTTERASTSGYTLLDTDGVDFDGITGIQGYSVDLADNTTADFFQAGSRYFIVISTVTVDGQTMSFVDATFDIGYPSATLNTWIATLSSQTSFTLTDGPAEDDALNGHWAIIHDAASKVQTTRVLVLDYTGSTKTVTLAAAGTFTVAAKDNFSLIGPAPLQPTTLGRTLDVSSGGEAGIDWANIGSVSTSVNLSGTTVKTATDVETDTQNIQSRIPAALGAQGNMKADLQDTKGSALPAGAAGGYVAIDWAVTTGTAATISLTGTTIKDVTDVETTLGTPAGADLAADIAAVKTDSAAIKTKTDQLAFTVANKVDSNPYAIAGSTTAATNLKQGALGVVPSTCAAGSTTTSVVTNLTEATDDHYNGGAIIFVTGALAGQRSSISDYDGTTKTLTVVALTEAPADTDAFVIV